MVRGELFRTSKKGNIHRKVTKGAKKNIKIKINAELAEKKQKRSKVQSSRFRITFLAVLSNDIYVVACPAERPFERGSNFERVPQGAVTRIFL